MIVITIIKCASQVHYFKQEQATFFDENYQMKILYEK